MTHPPGCLVDPSSCRNGATWTEQAKLLGSDSMPIDMFGSSISVLGDNVLAGAPYHGNGGPSNHDEGAAYRFTRTGTTWSSQGKLVVNDFALWALEVNFGYALALAETPLGRRAL